MSYDHQPCGCVVHTECGRRVTYGEHMLTPNWVKFTTRPVGRSRTVTERRVIGHTDHRPPLCKCATFIPAHVQ